MSPTPSPDPPSPRASLPRTSPATTIHGHQTRPHNKSILWEEFLEHFLPEQRYFNTKHKNAYCRRCIGRAIRELKHSQAERAEFEAYEKARFCGEGQRGSGCSWDEWVYRKSFDKIEAISGRSSNMQRHIKTCVHISNDDKRNIMANFEAAQQQAGSRSPSAQGGRMSSPEDHRQQQQNSSSLHPAAETLLAAATPAPAGFIPRGYPSASILALAPPSGNKGLGNVEQKDMRKKEMDGKITATFDHPNAAAAARPPEIKVSPRLSLKDILNVEPSPSSDATIRPQLSPTSSSSIQAIAQSSSARKADLEVIGRLDRAMLEISQARSQLIKTTIHLSSNTNASPSPSPYVPASIDNNRPLYQQQPSTMAISKDTLISRLRAEVDDLRRQNQALNRQNLALVRQQQQGILRETTVAAATDGDSVNDQRKATPVLFSPISHYGDGDGDGKGNGRKRRRFESKPLNPSPVHAQASHVQPLPR